MLYCPNLESHRESFVREDGLRRFSIDFASYEELGSARELLWRVAEKCRVREILCVMKS